ncbi:MAG: AAA family ATPase [Candidatus Omnitrophota bacterium]|jgi:general secretion pathway protein A
MYLTFFGLREFPFNLTPDPKFLYSTRYHREALSSLLYGIENRCGFIQITGEVGAGKTLLCRTLLQRLGAQVHSSLVFNPKLSESELLQVIVEDFGLHPARKTKKACYDALNRFLIEVTEKGFNAIVIVDEAQLLTVKALEQIRLLSNLETPDRKLLQIILVGQPELRDYLNRPDLKQLRQRITVRYHLPALSREDLGAYIAHRLEVAGAEQNFFTQEGMDLLHQFSGGIPRLINVLADRALMAAYTENSKLIMTSMVECAHEDLEGVRA